MTRPFMIALSSGVLRVAALFAFPFLTSAQSPPEIESLALRTADRVAKTHQQHIFVAGLQACQLDLETCASFEVSLRAALEKMDPAFHFVKRESVINILEGRGFIALDAFIPDVLKAVATSAGADILVTDTLQWQHDGYELTSEVYDAVQGKKLDQFRERVAHPVPDSGGEPVVITDQASRVSMIISTGKPERLPPGEYPTCVVCPDPTYTPEARAHRLQGRVLLLVTVTEKGAADQIGIIDGPGDGLIGQAVETVQGWQFKPAMGKDGKPFATRVPIEVTFRLR